MKPGGTAGPSPGARRPGPAYGRGRAPRGGDDLVVLPDAEALALSVAAAMVAEARSAVKRCGRFSVALSGGSTPRLTYELLGRPPFVDLLPWHRMHVFWGDERCVDAGDARSNERMTREALLDHVPIPAGQVHAVRCPGPGETGAAPEGAAAWRADAAAREYEEQLRAHGAGLDLVLFGLGEDGHVASLFPGSSALAESERWVVAALDDRDGGAACGGTGAGAEGGLWRVTLTAAFINQAASVFCIVSGAAKAGVLAEVLARDSDAGDLSAERLPALFIRPSSGGLRWFIDEEAASGLDRGGGVV